MKVEHEALFERTEMRMIRWMCGVGSLIDGNYYKCRVEKTEVESINKVERRNRLSRFGHVESKADEDWMKSCIT